MNPKINFFVVNTPFQEKVVTTLINQFFWDAENLIFSTLKKQTQVLNSSNTKIILIRRNYFAIKDLKRIKKLVFNYSVNNRMIEIFVPHLDNLLSSYFFSLVKNKRIDARINAYYEGIALFYDPDIRSSRMKLLSRQILSYCSGFRYQHFKKLFPKEFRHFAGAYTPLKDYPAGFKHNVHFSFEKSEVTPPDHKIGGILFVGFPLKTQEDLQKITRNIIAFFKAHNSLLGPFFFKPHFETNNNLLEQLVRIFSQRNYDLNTFSKEINLENLCDNYDFDEIVAFNRSSALINIKLIYDQKFSLSIYSDIGEFSEIDDIMKKLGVNFFISS